MTTTRLSWSKPDVVTASIDLTGPDFYALATRADRAGVPLAKLITAAAGSLLDARDAIDATQPGSKRQKRALAMFAAGVPLSEVVAAKVLKASDARLLYLDWAHRVADDLAAEPPQPDTVERATRKATSEARPAAKSLEVAEVQARRARVIQMLSEHRDYVDIIAETGASRASIGSQRHRWEKASGETYRGLIDRAPVVAPTAALRARAVDMILDGADSETIMAETGLSRGTIGQLRRATNATAA